MPHLIHQWLDRIDAVVQHVIDGLLRLFASRDLFRFIVARLVRKQAWLIRVELATLRAASPKHVRQLLVDRLEFLNTFAQATFLLIPIFAECLRSVDMRALRFLGWSRMLRDDLKLQLFSAGSGLMTVGCR